MELIINLETSIEGGGAFGPTDFEDAQDYVEKIMNFIDSDEGFKKIYSRKGRIPFITRDNVILKDNKNKRKITAEPYANIEMILKEDKEVG